jgi:hypothetical protein
LHPALIIAYFNTFVIIVNLLLHHNPYCLILTFGQAPSAATIMAFIVRRPFVITATLRQLPQVAKPTTRQFHQSTIKQTFFSSKPQQNAAFSKSRDAFRATFKRHYTPDASQAVKPDSSALRQRLLYGAGIFGGTIFAINMVFNRETRDDGGMPPFERSYLNDTFLHTGLGLGIIAVAARTLHMSGWSYRLMATNPWLVFGVGLAGSIGTMIGCQMTPPEK